MWDQEIISEEVEDKIQTDSVVEDKTEVVKAVISTPKITTVQEQVVAEEKEGDFRNPISPEGKMDN